MQIRHELRPLTSARGVAAWYVVFYHIREGASGSLPAGLMDFFAKGYLAVDFFFVLSGFVIWLNYRDLFGAFRWRAIPHFLWRRLARIYPLHLAVLIGTVSYAIACETTGRPLPTGYQWETLPYHAVLMQNWGLLPALGWNVPAWSISCELGAYLLFPLLAIAIDWRRLPSMALIGLLGGLMLGLWGLFDGMGERFLGNDIARLGLPRCLLEFAMGTIVAALWLRWREAPRPAAIGSALLGLAGLEAYWLGAAEPLVLPFVFVNLVLLLALTAARTSPLQGRIVHWFGEISYATYLAHAFLFLLFKVALVADPAAIPLPMLGLFVLILLAVSALLYHGFELPAQRWLNRRGPQRPAST